MNHDALFKKLLKTPTVLCGFFEAFLPEAFRFIDFDVLEFVDKERFTIDARKRTGDLLIKTRFRERAAGFLIHFEHQAQPDQDLGRRMLEYFLLDWREFDLPVYPIAVLSHKEAPQAGPVPLQVNFPNRKVLHFDFDIIDLARMDARRFVELENPAALALSSRMKIGRGGRVALARDFFVNLAVTRISRSEQELVAGFYSAYQPLSEGEALQLEQELGRLTPDEAREKAMQLTNPFIELGKKRGLQEGIQQGLQEGMASGRRQGEVELVLRQLNRRLGSLSATQEKAVRKLDLPVIEALGEALLEFSVGADLTRWLRGNSVKGGRGSRH